MVVDVACGTGTLPNKLKEKYDFRGYGVDISEKMVGQARIRNPEMNIYASNCNDLTFADGQMRATYSSMRPNRSSRFSLATDLPLRENHRRKCAVDGDAKSVISRTERMRARLSRTVF